MLPWIVLPALLATAPFVPWVNRGARDQRPVAVIVREFDAVHYPGMSEGSDPESLAKFEQEIRAAAERQQALALELATDHPEHARVAELLRTRWTLFSTVQADGEMVLRETDAWLARQPDAEIVKAAAATRALAAVTVPSFDFARRRAIVEAELARGAAETLVGDALMQLAFRFTADPALQQELATVARREFANDEYVADHLTMVEQLLARVGKPLELRFEGVDADRTPDAPTQLSAWRGKPCLIHLRFWTPGWLGDEQKAADAALAALRTRWSAAALPALTVATLYDATDAKSVIEEARSGGAAPLWIDRATFEHSIARDQLGLSREGAWLLVGADGVLRAWSWNLPALVEQLDRLLAPKRRAA